MARSKDKEWSDIKLSSKVFGHISQGLYRSPAGAIKELVSNAFDACATTVRINTNFPRFDMFSCEDDGTGLSKTEFLRLMNEGVGNSYKRIEGEHLNVQCNRRIIGRLGIGLLSLAQVCTEFDLISHCGDAKTGEAFKVTLLFPPYTREEIDKIKRRSKGGFFLGGQYKITNIDYDPTRRGVRVFTKYLRRMFVKRMRELERFGNFRTFKTPGPYRSFDEFITSIYKDLKHKQSLSLFSDYDQLLFDLAMIPPLSYLDTGENVMLVIPFFKKYQRSLKQNKFQLFVDNLELHRPLLLPSDLAQNTAQECRLAGSAKKKFTVVDGPISETVDVEKFDIALKDADEKFSAYYLSYNNKKVAGRPLRFWGYLFQQTGRLYPRDINGVLVRIRDVAIGRYDPSLMAYPYGEGPRYSMISCELVVEEGFEDALNIDRDSFNTLDPHYLRMQAYLHNLLHEVIFPEAWSEEKSRNKARRETAKEERQHEFIEVLKSHSGGQFGEIIKVEEKGAAPSSRPVVFDPKRRAVVINIKHPLFEGVVNRRKHEELAEHIIVAFETAVRGGTSETQRELFYELLAKVFSLR